MRTFVAVPIPPPVRARLVQVQEALRRADADVRWVEAENLHLTLKFLGDLEEPEVERLRELLGQEARRWPELSLRYEGVGVFPSSGLPRVVWAGARGDLEKLAGLAQAIERAALQVGVPREGRPFVAHLTLGRVKSGRRLEALRSALENQREASFGDQTLRGFVLLQSTLTPQGSIYEPLAEFPLGSAP
jgi:2'-5' RNA ligase